MMRRVAVSSGLTRVLLLLAIAAIGTSCATAGGEGTISPGTDAQAARTDAQAGPLVDAPPSSPFPDALPGCSDMELLQNPSFDLGSGQSWIEMSSAMVINDAAALPLPPHSGSFSAWLGGLENSSDALYQDVFFPEGTRSVALHGYRFIVSQEAPENGPQDTLTIAIRNSQTSALVETVVTFSNVDEDVMWTEFARSLLGNYGGLSARFSIEVRTSPVLNSNFLLDTLSLRATVCP